MIPVTDRKAEYPILPLILNRWSPRAMSGEELTDKELFPLFEAARWAPSSRNSQPWRFCYAKKNSPSWKGFFELLVEGNQKWAKDAGVLIIIVSKNTFDNGSSSRTHSFDTGSAFENLALQGRSIGLVIHPMEGFDYQKAKELLKLNDDWSVECMVAIGKPGKKEDLPPALQEREIPSQRKALKEIVFQGEFKE